jgi:hypothetical protein
MLIATAYSRVTRRQSVMGDVCVRALWEGQAHFAGQGIAVGTKVNKEEAPDA